jgi:propanol-preferring alcohol dehydrogenase
MKAMILMRRAKPLRLAEVPRPTPGADQVLLEVRACGVCRTDLHVIDGDLRQPRLPLVLGHEIVGVVVEKGAEVQRFALGQRVGVPWLGRTCGHCRYCSSGAENLCDAAEFTGYTLDGGYAEFALADQNYCFSLPDTYSDAEAAPLLCAGLIGYRSLVAAGDARRLGIYGFGAAAHIIAQVARWQGREVFAFTKPGDVEGQEFARQLGAAWAGGADAAPPREMDAAILFAPVGELVPQALRHTAKGRHGGLRRHPHEQHPRVPLLDSLGRALRPLDRQPDPARRRGVLRRCAPGRRQDGSECFPLESANEALQQAAQLARSVAPPFSQPARTASQKL